MIVVCGDSFLAPDPAVPNRHFSEIMCATSLAKPGCSNIDICFQIQEAIKIKPSWIIIGTTDSARTELKITDEVFHNLKLENFRNGDYISDTIPTLIGEEEDLKDKYYIHCDRRVSVKRYFTDIYDSTLKHITDMWALGYWFQQLQDCDIKYTVLDKSFCIYEYATNHPFESYSFHTDFKTQEKAAILLLQQ